MKVKYRFTQPLLVLGMLVISIVYSLILLIFYPIILLGSFIWKERIFWKEISWYISLIPVIPDVTNNDENQDGDQYEDKK